MSSFVFAGSAPSANTWRLKARHADNVSGASSSRFLAISRETAGYIGFSMVQILCTRDAAEVRKEAGTSVDSGKTVLPLLMPGAIHQNAGSDHSDGEQSHDIRFEDSAGESPLGSNPGGGRWGSSAASDANRLW